MPAAHSPIPFRARLIPGWLRRRRFAAVLAAATAAGFVGAAVPAHAATTALSISPSTTVQWRGDTRVSVRLTYDGHSLPGRRVVVYWRRHSTEPWGYGATLTTNSHGWASMAQDGLEASREYKAVGAGVDSPVSTVTVRSLGASVVYAASRKAGDPYEYGAAGPNAFDCSGLTMYIWREFGYGLPHNAAAQFDLRGMRHLSHSEAAPGDFLFFESGGSIYHVAIYAGHGEMWHAPHSGDHVRLASIYSPDYYVGRL